MFIRFFRTHLKPFPLFSSIAIHGLIAIALLVAFENKNFSSKKQMPLLIEVIGKRSTLKSSHLKSKLKNKIKREKSKNSGPYLGLDLPSHLTAPIKKGLTVSRYQSQSQNEEFDRFESEVFDGADGFDIARRMSIETESKIYPFFARIHKELSEIFTYPSSLIEDDRRGTVTVQVLLNDQGQLIKEITEFSGEDPLLTNYVLGLIYSKLSRPLVHMPKVPFKKIKTVLVFDFLKFKDRARFDAQQTKHAKNVLHFSRAAFESEVEVITESSVPFKDSLPNVKQIDFGKSIELIQRLGLLGGNDKELDQFKNKPTPPPHLTGILFKH